MTGGGQANSQMQSIMEQQFTTQMAIDNHKISIEETSKSQVSELKLSPRSPWQGIY